MNTNYNSYNEAWRQAREHLDKDKDRELKKYWSAQQAAKRALPRPVPRVPLGQRRTITLTYRQKLVSNIIVGLGHLSAEEAVREAMKRADMLIACLETEEALKK